MKVKICPKCGFINKQSTTNCRGRLLEENALCNASLTDKPAIGRIGGEEVERELLGRYYDEQTGRLYDEPFRTPPQEAEVTFTELDETVEDEDFAIAEASTDPSEDWVKVCACGEIVSADGVTECPECNRSLLDVDPVLRDSVCLSDIKEEVEEEAEVVQEMLATEDDSAPEGEKRYCLRAYSRRYPLKFDENGIAFIGADHQTEAFGDNDYVSSHHCIVIKQEHDTFLLVDTSRNGTVVHKGEVRRYPLCAESCHIRLGETFYLIKNENFSIPVQIEKE